MKIGISTASFFTKESTDAAFELINKAKIPLCEVFLCTLSEYEPDFVRTLKDLQSCTEIYSIHSLNQQYEPELFNPLEKTRKDCERIFRQVAKCCRFLDAKCYIFHGPAQMKKLPFTFDYQKIGKRMEELREIMREESENTEVCYENVHWAHFKTPEFFEKLRVHTDVKTCLDIKQAMLSGYDIYDYIKVMDGRIENVHLCDYDSDGRLALPGKGNFDFIKLFRTLKEAGYTKPAMLEVYPSSYVNYDELMQSMDFLNECVFKANNN